MLEKAQGDENLSTGRERLVLREGMHRYGLGEVVVEGGQGGLAAKYGHSCLQLRSSGQGHLQLRVR